MLICIWGNRMQYFGEVKNNFQQIFSDFDIDWLISTWDDVNTDGHDFKFILKSPQPTTSQLYDINFIGTSQIRHHPEYEKLKEGQYAQVFHKTNIHQFIKSNNLQYDALVISRNDLWFETNYIFDFEKEIVYVPLNFMGGPGTLNDHFSCGKFDYVLKSMGFSSVREYVDFLEESDPWNPEHALMLLFEKLNISWMEFTSQKYRLFPDRYWEF